MFPSYHSARLRSKWEYVRVSRRRTFLETPRERGSGEPLSGNLAHSGHLLAGRPTSTLARRASWCAPFDGSIPFCTILHHSIRFDSNQGEIKSSCLAPRSSAPSATKLGKQGDGRAVSGAPRAAWWSKPKPMNQQRGVWLEWLKVA